MSNVEHVQYKVVEKFGSIEVRYYPRYIVAEVKTNGTQKEAVNKGFRIIADYIFGNNNATESTLNTSKKIPMTAPVLQRVQNDDSWIIQFVMPKIYTLDTLPKPNNPAIHLKEIQDKSFVAITFSGLANFKNLKKNTQRLNLFIEEHKLYPESLPIYAFFNPPWTLPFLRRNEVLVEVSNDE